MPSRELADVWVVAGPPASGKTTAAALLLDLLSPTPALLDKDTMFDSITAAMLAATGRPYGDREGAWYDEHIKPYEYAGLQATAREIRSHGCPVLISAPFTASSRDTAKWRTVCEDLGGGTVHLVWMATDEATLRHRLVVRGAERDCGKFEDVETFLNRVRPEEPPPFDHFVVRNTLDETRSIGEQLIQVITTVRGGEASVRAQGSLAG